MAIANRPAIRNRFAAQTAAKPDTTEDLIAKGRVLAERNVKSFIPALRASTVMIEERLPTIAAVDKWWRTYWNPRGVQWFVDAAAAVSKTNPCPTCGATSHNRFAYLAGVWVHEVGHCVFRHWQRQEEQGFTNDSKWNIAGDLEMNDDIPGIGAAAEKHGHEIQEPTPAMCLPNAAMVDPNLYMAWYSGGSAILKALNMDIWDMFRPVGAEGTENMIRVPFMMFPEKVPTGIPMEYISLETGRIAEVYYEQIPDPPKKGQPGSGGEGQSGGKGGNQSGQGKGSKGMDELNDHGSGSGGDQRYWEDGKPGEGSNAHGITEAEGQAIRRDVATKIKETSNGRGTVPAGWQVWADAELLPPKVRWQDKLRAIARQAINRVRGEKYNTYRRLSRSSIVQDCRIIKPSQYDVVPVVVIVVDTSGSMGAGSRSRLERALSECEAILKLNKVKAYFLDCDANVYGKAQEVRSLRSAKVNGGGGTDMRVGVLAALKNKPKPDIVVLLTDGETPWPSASEVSQIKMITAICNERNVPVPPHMNAIWVDD